MIVLPKYKDIHVDTPIPFSVGIGGEVKYILRDLMGRPVMETDWSSNTIYDAGLDLIATDSLFASTVIGDSNAATVEAGPNQLSSRVGPQSDTRDDDAAYGYAGVAPWWFSRTFRSRFNAGVAMTVREMGVNRVNQADNLYCRHLVVPEFSKTVDQILDIYYKHIYYPPLGDVVLNNVPINGVLYNTILRGCNYGRQVDGENGAFTKMGEFTGTGGSTYKRHFDGDIGLTNENFPSGNATTSYGFPTSTLGYTPGNHYIDGFVPLRLQDGNLATGQLLRSTLYPFNGGALQIQWDSQDFPGFGIPKTASEVMDITFRQSWVRHVP